MLDGSPILDIKPYLSSVPPDQLRRGWMAKAEAVHRSQETFIPNSKQR
jgi:tRNA (Thr-GGU) A37 N-methylase